MNAQPLIPEAVARWQENQASLAAYAEIDRSTTQVGQALRLADVFEHRLGFVPELKQWHVFTRAGWVPDVTGYALQAVRLVLAAGQAKAQSEGQEARRRALMQLERAPAMRAILEIAATDPRFVIRLAAFDRDPLTVHTPAGLRINLRDLTTRPTEPQDFNLLCLGVDPDFEGEAPTFARALLEICAGRHELAGWLVARWGYAMTGLTTFQDLEFHVGHGRNGKSLLQKLRAYIWGSYRATVDSGFFLEDGKTSGPSPELLAIRGRRLIEGSETIEGARLRVARIKALSSGDEQATRALFSNVVSTFSPVGKLVLATNAAPMLGRVDYAIRRRVRLVPFEVRFDGSREDPELLGKLEVEAPAILGEILRAAAAFAQSRQLPTCDAIETASKDYLDSEDLVQRWITERAIVDPGASTAASRLYADFVAWQEAEGSHPWTATSFGRALGEHGFPIKKCGIVFREGLRLE